MAMCNGGFSIALGAHNGWIDIANFLTLFASVLVAAVAIWYTTKEARRNQSRSELSIAPALNNYLHANEYEMKLGLEIGNVGAGPAIIEAIYFVYQGVAIDITGDQNWFLKLEGTLRASYPWLMQDLLKLRLNPGGITKGMVIGPGEKLWIGNMPRASLDSIELAQFQKFLLNSNIVAFYQSMHGRRYNNLDPYVPDGNMASDVSPQTFIRGRYPPPRPPSTV
jgi:hypothetical protein